MPFTERVEELDREIRSTVARAFTELRDDLAQRLHRSHDELLLHLEELEPTLPAELLSLSELGPIATQEAETARRAAFAELRDGLAALDHARSQAEVLAALLDAAGRYASRSLLLLTRAGELRGWGGRGFGDEAGVRALGLPLPGGGPWATLAGGGGTVPLTAPQCAELCSRLESELPRDGVLVPLVLRDRVAAALYADRTGGDELLLEPLQALVYAAAQAIESLPFRERGSTATLHLAVVEAPPEGVPPEAAAAEPPTPTGEPEAVPAAPPAVEGMIAAEAEPAVPETAPEPGAASPEGGARWDEGRWGDEPAIASTEAAVVAAETGAWQAESARETPEAVAETAPWAVVPPPSAAAEAAPVWGESLEEDETAGMTPSLDDTAAIAGSPLEDTEAGSWRLEDEGLAAVAEPPALEPLPETTVESWRSAPTAAWQLPRYREPAAEPPAAELVEPAAAAAEAAPEPLGAQEAAAPAAQSQETVMLRAPVTEPVPSPYGGPAAAPPPSPGPAQTVRIAAFGGEVQPPQDVQGPGWAFATARIPTTGVDAHEEARRLARLLVSEIKLYNEEQVEEGRRNRDLYERLKDDIDRSRQLYEERVETSVLNSTDYFYQELVRILAAGDARALGI
jgi:hypothetical protein